VNRFFLATLFAVQRSLNRITGDAGRPLTALRARPAMNALLALASNCQARR
jgi:hypothetical protein